MPELVRLALETADGRPLVHKFYRHPEGSDSLLVTLPGNHYGVDGPLLYYPSEILGASGWDTLALSYGFQTAMADPFEAGMQALLEECRAAVLAVVGGRSYGQIGLAGKSLGTALVAHLCSTEPHLANARAAYLTPMLGTPFFDSLFTQTSQPAFLAVGTADRFYDAEALETLRAAKPFALTLVEGADHSMDVPGDLDASLEAVRRVVGALLEFFREGRGRQEGEGRGEGSGDIPG